MKYRDKTCLVYDNGGYVDVARVLSRDFKKVYYYTNWQKAFPKSNDTLVGSGFNEFERINFFWDKINDIDLFVFTDIGNGDLQDYLVSIGKNVWGSRSGQRLEMDREYFFDFIKKQGLSVPETDYITGTTALREFLQNNEDKFVKLDSVYRGDIETFKHINYDVSKPIIDSLEYKFGERKEQVKFIVQQNIDSVSEIGYDGWCIDGEFPLLSLSGVESKDKGYFGKVMRYTDLPKEVKAVNDAFVYYFKEIGYRGMWSTEIRLTNDGKFYFIDPTPRFPSPPSNCLLYNLNNLAEVLYEGAQGNLVTPDFEKEFVGEIILTSPFAKEGNFYQLFCEDSIKENVFQQYACRINDMNYVVPQEFENDRVGEIVCAGDRPEDVINDIAQYSEKVKGHQLNCNASAVEEAFEEFKTVY